MVLRRSDISEQVAIVRQDKSGPRSGPHRGIGGETPKTDLAWLTGRLRELTASGRSRQRTLLATAAVVLVVSLVAAWLFTAPGPARGVPSSRADLGLEEDSRGSPDGPAAGPHGDADSATAVWVHVAGAVTNPGVYHLLPGSRVNDAVAAAGGATEIAELAAVNLAAELVDGSQVFVPPRDSVSGAASGSSQYGAATGDGLSHGDGSATGSAGVRKVNINRATEKELEALPGVGPATAARIVEFRKANGAFKTVSELRKVSGIGESKLAQIAPVATV